MRLILVICMLIFLSACKDENKSIEKLNDSAGDTPQLSELDSMRPPIAAVVKAPDVTGLLPKSLYPPEG